MIVRNSVEDFTHWFNPFFFRCTKTAFACLNVATLNLVAMFLTCIWQNTSIISRWILLNMECVIIRSVSDRLLTEFSWKLTIWQCGAMATDKPFIRDELMAWLFAAVLPIFFCVIEQTLNKCCDMLLTKHLSTLPLKNVLKENKR